MTVFVAAWVRSGGKQEQRSIGFLIKHYAGNFPLWFAPEQMRVIGGRDMDAGLVSVRLHTGGSQGAIPKAEVVADILQGIEERRA